ncbi:MAG: mitochondrial fission ELM1 family protein [Rickettsia endosymbiont of Bryobia graminum]|nr:mitochondrial fission ELM1 family protein [Rickettsia endosymbiont of Bryobia graminum]
MINKFIIITLLSAQFTGDNANVNGITDALQKILPAENIKIVTSSIKDGKYQIDSKKISEVQNKINNSKDNIIILGAGNYGRALLDQLDKHTNNDIDLKFVWSGHQIPENFKNFEHYDAIILPKSANPEKQIIIKNKTKLIQTIGVPHNKTIQQIDEEYKNWVKNITLPNNSGLVLVVLPGDAPDQSNTQHYYTAENAEVLGSKLGKFAKEHNKILLVTNGPRTGKYKAGTDELMSDHKSNSPMDLVTQAFVNAVNKEGLNSAYIIVSDFKYGEKNLYDAFLGAIRSNKANIAIIAGESTSQITIATNLLNLGQVYVLSGDYNQAMSSSHINFINDVVTNGIVQKFPSNYERGPFIPKFTGNIRTDAECAAEGIYKLIDNDHVSAHQ